LEREPNSFEALSYVWGDPSVTTPIQVNDATLEIGINLRTALLNLRRADSIRILWIDAICMNQNDINERASQVAIMGDIYRKASRTVIWLGDALKTTPACFSMLNTLGNEAMEPKASQNPVQVDSGSALEKYGNDTSLEETILENEWWGRVWTAQEVILSRKAVIVQGHYEADWDLFTAAMHYITSAKSFKTLEALQLSNSSYGTFVFKNFLAMDKLIYTGNVGDDLLRCLLYTRHRDASDPRDKIFGVFGFITGDLQGNGFTPDYRAPVRDVYCKTTRSLIQTSGNLDVLGVCFPFKDRKVPDLPSWVADWSSTEICFAQPLMDDAQGNKRATHASRNHAAQPQWEGDGETLVIQGHSIDTISALSAVQHGVYESDYKDLLDSIAEDDADDLTPEAIKASQQDVSARNTFRKYGEAAVNFGQAVADGRVGKIGKLFTFMVPLLSVYVEWEKFVKAYNPTNPSGDCKNSNPMSIYCQTLCTGTLAPGGLPETERLFQAWIDSFYFVRKLKDWKVDRGSSKAFRTLSFLGYTTSTWKDLGEFPKYLTHVKERRLGITKKGYLCLLPQTAEVGDQLALLKGGRVPVILRQRNGYMEFVGEAYVHGIMDGEAFEEEKCYEIRIE